MNDLVNIIRLIRTENVGPKTFWNLLNHFSSLQNALSYIEHKFAKKPDFKLCSTFDAEREIENCHSKNIKILSFLDAKFPQLLKNIDDCPPIIFAQGNIELLNKTCISIIGSRNASLNGLRFAHKIAKDLGLKEKIIVSGFAKGIDTAAHKASLEYGTIAVFAGGIDHIYPSENKELYFQILDKGLIVAELPLGTVPKSQNFPQRNRIISGLSSVTAVIEASLRSGSLITARNALEQNRDLFVVPGFPLDPHYQGNNWLIKQGANLLENADDIIEALTSKKIFKTSPSLFNEGSKNFQYNDDFSEKELTQTKAEIINLLSITPSLIDDLLNEISSTPSVVITALIDLELEGKIIRHFGNQVSLKY